MSETWVIKDTAPVDENSYELAKTNISFASGGANFVAFEVYTDGIVIWLKYYPTANTVFEPGSFEPGMGEDRFSWRNNAYKTITFDTHPTGALLTWLQTNATLQEDTTVVEYLTTNIDLKKVANAIRAKSGTTAKLSFPDGFVQAIGGEEYDGDYKVTPKFTEEVLKTKNKIMKDNVLVYPIEVARVSNPSGGTTIYIGGITNG